jgi:V8-like Glu-specific endopeptidase
MAVDHAPLTIAAARRIWAYEKITDFSFPQPLRPVRKIARRPAEGEKRAHTTSPGLPAARDITAVPLGARRRPSLRARGRSVDPLYIYPPDGRYVFSDTTYPWCCCGRVTTPTSQASGVLVGPRHMLTASHVIDWTETNGLLGWVTFQPDFNNGDVFPPSNAVSTLYYEQNSPSSMGEYSVAEDYVVCTMDRRLGDELGYLGTKTYDDSWDQEAWWVNVGYPGDLGGGLQPSFQGPISIANSWQPGFFELGSGRDMETFASLTPGDSGGPIFGWWTDGPHVVGVVSGQGGLSAVISDLETRTGNWAGGGSPLPDLVNQARSNDP